MMLSQTSVAGQALLFNRLSSIRSAEAELSVQDLVVAGWRRYLGWLEAFKIDSRSFVFLNQSGRGPCHNCITSEKHWDKPFG